MYKKNLCSLAALPLIIIYLELITKLFCFGAIDLRNGILTVLFSLSAGVLLTLLCSFFGEKHFFKALWGTTFLLCILFCVQNVYHNIFGTFFSLFSATEAAGVLSNFWREALEGIRRSILEIAAIILPLVALIVLRRQFSLGLGAKQKFSVLIAFLLLHLSAVCCVFTGSSGVISTKYLYTGDFMPELSVRCFGVLTTERLDLRQLILPASAPGSESTPSPADSPVPSPIESPTETPAETPIVYGPNVMDIDFNSLISGETNTTIKNMHEHFASIEPTMQNEYTGLFEGKNLIWIVAEGFSDLALDETHTPTLYRMANTGFVFNNFYTPSWGVSTSDGEYITLTGLLPKSGVWSFTESASNNMGMTFGRMLGSLGYDCRAYHNHTYDYYNRDKSHPNMGYNYTGVGNGLDMEPVWPASDLEMLQETVDDYIGADKFHTYYMTVSGHMYYTFNGNTQAYRHMDDVADLPYSSNCRAYIACNMEFDLSMEYLIDRLTEAGKLEDTVIVISGDHYPYGLTDAEIEEIRGYGVDDNFELYRSGLIIWSGAMQEPVDVDKYCYSADIMPTLANLFNLDYDSRLLAGRDIFSTEAGFVIFANRSFISDYGRYNSTTDEFFPTEGVQVPENYARDTIYGRVSDAFAYSAAILDNDYYSIVLPKAAHDGILVN